MKGWAIGNRSLNGRGFLLRPYTVRRTMREAWYAFVDPISQSIPEGRGTREQKIAMAKKDGFSAHKVLIYPVTPNPTEA